MLGAIVFGYLGISSYISYQNYPKEPEVLTFNQALKAVESGQHHWVKITDPHYDCTSLTYVRDLRYYDTEIIVTNEDRTVVAYAEFSGKRTCDTIQSENTPLEGEVYQLTSRRYKYLITHVPAFYQYMDRGYIDICTHCGRDNTFLGIICGAVFTPLCLALYPMFKAMKRGEERK